MDDRLAAALELLDEVGVATPSIGMSISGAAVAAGVNRSTIYRHWPTAADLNTDLAVISACHLPGWQRRILEVPPSADLEDAVHASLADRPVEVGTPIRALAAGWAPDVAARQAIAAWEAEWLGRLADWVDAHVHAHGRTWVDGATPDVLAVGVAATIEGWLIARTLEGALEHLEPVTSPVAPVQRVRLLVEQLTVAVDAPSSRPWAGSAPQAPSTPAYPEARLAIAMKVIATCIDPTTGRWLAEPPRLVDLERLARRIDVSPRWLYELWPTAGDMNAAIIEGWFERDRQAIDQYAAAWLAESGPAGRTTPAERFTVALDDSIRRRVGKVAANQFSLSQAAGDPVVRATLDRIQEDYRVLLRLIYLSSLSIAGWKQRPSIGVDEYTAIMFEGNLGLDRLVALHPDLLDREVLIQGRPNPFCGGIHFLIGQSATLPVDAG